MWGSTVQNIWPLLFLCYVLRTTLKIVNKSKCEDFDLKIASKCVDASVHTLFKVVWIWAVVSFFKFSSDGLNDGDQTIIICLFRKCCICVFLATMIATNFVTCGIAMACLWPRSGKQERSAQVPSFHTTCARSGPTICCYLGGGLSQHVKEYHKIRLNFMIKFMEFENWDVVSYYK